MNIVHKTHAGKSGDGKTFVLSDETPDRMGDVIMAEGWDLADFRKNPIALFNHSKDWIVGTWKNLRIEGHALLGELEPAPKGISERADEITRFIEAGVLKSVSVGFLPLERKIRRKGEEMVGYTFTKQTLVESSIVAVPANPNALAIAKELNLSSDACKLVFAVSGNEPEQVRKHDHIGEFANLKELDRWSPEQATQAKRWLATLARQHPSNRMFKKLYQLMDEIECVRTIIAEQGRTAR